MSERARALEQALRELTAMVRGECPSLLNEDSGGNGDLSYQIEKLLAVDTAPSGASSVDAPIYRQVYIVTHYPEGGLRGVHASQAGAEAEIAELCREYPDYTRQDFSIVCDRIRPNPPSGASYQQGVREWVVDCFGPTMACWPAFSESSRARRVPVAVIGSPDAVLPQPSGASPQEPRREQEAAGRQAGQASAPNNQGAGSVLEGLCLEGKVR